MVVKLRELLDRVPYELAYFSPTYRDITDKPSNYRLLKISERKEIREIGKVEIPKRRGITNFFDNDFYEPGRGYAYSPKLFSKRIRVEEFDSGKKDEIMAIIEHVKDLKYVGRGRIELIIEKYLIREKEKLEKRN